MMTTVNVDIEDTETMTQESDCSCSCNSDMNSANANTNATSSVSTANANRRPPNNGHGKRRRLHHIILLATTAFIWMVPWLLVQEIGAVRHPPVGLNRRGDTMSNEEVRNYLKIYNAGSTIPQSSTTPLPSPSRTKPKSKTKSQSSQSPNSRSSSSNSRANIIIKPKPPIWANGQSSSSSGHFSTTTARSSFIPTEVMPAGASVPMSSTTTTTTATPSLAAKDLHEALPTPAKLVQEQVDARQEKEEPTVLVGVNDTVGELFQSLNILHALLGTNANTDDITSALLPTLTTTTTTTTPASTPAFGNPILSFDESLQALSLLNSLLGNGNTNNGNANASVSNINLGSSNALLASLGLPQEVSSVGTRQANQLGLSEPLTSSLANLLFGGQSNVNNPPQQQNFLNFKNTGSQMDSSGTTTQMSGLMGLLNTLGQFGGSSQGSSLFNFAQTGTQSTPNYLSTLFRPSQQQQQPQTPNYLSLLFGNNAQQQTKTPAQNPTSDFLAGILNGGTGKSAQAEDVSNAPSNNLLGLSSLLGSSSNTQNNLFSALVGGQQQQQTPSLVSSLGTIGTSLASIAGTALTGLSGSNNGKPRVRGMDTRLGLGYRFGPNADAQVLWEIGPQLFTEPLPNEQREQLIKIREHQARKQLEMQQQQVQTLQQQLRQLEEEKRFRELQAEERARQAAAEAAREMERRMSEMQQEASNVRLRKTNKRHRPFPTWSEILFKPEATVESLAVGMSALLPTPMAMAGQVRPRAKQSGVSRLNPAGALLSHPQPTAKPKRANSILTTYERHLLQQPAVSPSAQPAAEFARRTVNAPAPAKRNIPSPVHLHRTNQFFFSGVPTNAGNQHRIVRMRQINRRPIALPPPGQRLSRDKIRHTKMRSIPHPVHPQHQHPVPIGQGVENQFQDRMGVAAAAVPDNPHQPPRSPSVHPQNPVQQQHLRQRHQRNANAHSFNQQEIISEREDSFIRRNAGPYMPHVPQHQQMQMPHRGPSHHHNQNRRTILDVGEDGLPSILSKIRPSVNTVFGMWNNMRTSGNPLTRLMSAENIIPSPDQVVPPDSLDTFNCYFCNGDYVPTTKPPLVARPLPPGHNVTVPQPHPHSHVDSHLAASNQNPAVTPASGGTGTRRLPGLVSKIRDTVINRITGGGSGPKRDQHPSDSEQRPAVHIGENLTPEQLTNLMSPHLSQQGQRDNPYVTTAKIKYQTDQILSFVPTGRPATPTIAAPPPVHVPGVEMFIDIDNGDVSVRKNIGKLTGFDEDDFTTTTPRPKTEEELEDEESQKIFQQVQEYLHNSYEEMKFNQALEKEMKKYKDKLSSGQDEMSHGAVSQMFDVLAKRQGVVPPDPALEQTIRRRHRRDVFSTVSL